ncbi:MAG: winged helix-turn-helix domain-containing protein [Planktotalea sp.]|uniref:ArsR/SmtB family transcription factor n=1 Tax=Planktotalea sp. TaxID=2029877 RepID=UPI003C763A54
MIPSHTIAESFSALSHASRVDILLALMPHAGQGLSAGELSKRTQIPPSTLAHHLREMETGQVILRIPDGRRTIVKPNLATLTQIAALVSQLCCSAEASTEPEGLSP